MKTLRLKKLFSFILTLSLIISLASPNIMSTASGNQPFTDVFGDEYYAAAADILAKLDILKGYPDGTFGADNDITRAEITAVALRALDLESEAEQAVGETDYIDVPEDHWASGYINIASERGIIQGDGNGYFRPEDNVKYEEAIKIVVETVGLGADAIEASGWTNGYISVAKENGIIEKVPGELGVASVRGAVALMTYQALLSMVKAPIASLVEGEYTTEQIVSLTSPLKSAAIFYTLDGSTPTTDSTIYSQALNLDETTTLKAIAVSRKLLVSNVFSASYIINLTTELSNAALPAGAAAGAATGAASSDLTGSIGNAINNASGWSKGWGNRTSGGGVNANGSGNGSGGSGGGSGDSSGDSSGGGSENGNGEGSGGNNAYSLSINTDKFISLDDDGELYAITDKIDALTGNLTGSADAISLRLKISFGNYLITDSALNIANNWNYPNPNLILDASNKIEVKAEFINGTTLEKTIMLVNENGENFDDSDLDTNDNDGDGIPNWLEDALGTDKDNVDTDGDGIDDYYEVFILGTNPLLLDSDGSGIGDGEKDFDEDGLTNIHEYLYGTDPYDPDTDGDGLSDYDEIMVYHSDPLKIDSDDDGLNDALEIFLDMDPMKADSLNDGVPDGDRMFDYEAFSADTNAGDSVMPSLSIRLQGKLIPTLNIKKVSDNDIFLNKFMAGYIGNAFNFDIDGEFENAVLTFEIETSLLNDPSFEPVIYYWNEDRQMLEEVLGQYVSGNKVIAPLEHFSSYVVLNRIVYEDAMDKDIKAPNFAGSNVDLAIVIDNSGSMDADPVPKNDPNRLRHVVAKDLIDKLGVDDRVCIVNFASSVSIPISFTNNKQAAKDAVDSFYNSGSTALYTAVYLAASRFESYSNEDAIKIMVVLTDGIDNMSNVSLSTATQEAIKNGVTIYTVGLGYDLDLSALNSLASSTGGVYYHASNASNLSDIFDRIAEEDIQIDTDGDGLPDYYEKLINDGTLLLGSGAPLWALDGAALLSWDIPAITDSDGDNLNDGNEVRIEVEMNPNGSKKVWVFLLSNPCLADSDDDGWLDDEDPTPLKKGLKDGIYGAIKIFSASDTGPASSGDFSGHAWLIYTSFIKDEVSLYGRYMESLRDNANPKVAMTSPTTDYAKGWHSIKMARSTCISIGTWAGWLDGELLERRGTWLNAESLFGAAAWSYKFSIEDFVTEKELNILSSQSQANDKWTNLANCSAFAVDTWNSVFDDSLSARGYLLYRNPSSLMDSIQSRSDYKVNDAFLSEVPEKYYKK